MGGTAIPPIRHPIIYAQVGGTKTANLHPAAASMHAPLLEGLPGLSEAAKALTLEQAMNESTHEAVIQRLARLEQAHRRWRMLGCAAIAILGLVVLLGSSGAKVHDDIQARRFVLADKEGKERARLGIHPQEGGPSLELYDKDGKSRAQLSINANGSSILDLNSANSPDARASLVVGVDGSALLNLEETDGRILMMAEKGHTGATFSGKDADGLGALRATIPATAPPPTPGKPPRRIAIALINQGRFVWIVP
jgi:hypothetical protein